MAATAGSAAGFARAAGARSRRRRRPRARRRRTRRWPAARGGAAPGRWSCSGRSGRSGVSVRWGVRILVRGERRWVARGEDPNERRRRARSRSTRDAGIGSEAHLMTVFARFASRRVERVPVRRAQRDNGKSVGPITDSARHKEAGLVSPLRARDRASHVDDGGASGRVGGDASRVSARGRASRRRPPRARRASSPRVERRARREASAARASSPRHAPRPSRRRSRRTTTTTPTTTNTTTMGSPRTATGTPSWP